MQLPAEKTMYLNLGGEEVCVEVEEESAFGSRHTGSSLRRVRVGLAVQTLQAHKRLLFYAKGGETVGLSSTDGRGNTTGRWLVTESDFSTDDEPEYYHTLLLDEVEELKIDGLSIDDLILQPYLYEEEFDCDDLSITARVVVSPEVDRTLRDLMRRGGYVTVIRHGICEEPREMRFGRTILWSREDGLFKYEVILVDRSYDERDRPLARLFQPQISRMQRVIASQAALLDELLLALEAKGVMGGAEVEALRSRAREAAWDREREFYEVDDLDRFLNPPPRVTWD